MILDELDVPIVLAPMAGGPSTPALAAAVAEAGGLGSLAAGNLGTADLAERIAAVRAATSRPIAVNLFVPAATAAPPAVVDGYLAELAAAGFAVGEPRFDDDGWNDKLDLLTTDPVPVVTFTFGLPAADVVERLHRVGSEVWVTVTAPDEADRALANGADVLIAQGAEAGGHQAAFVDRTEDDLSDPLGLLALLQLLAGRGPLVAAGGITTGAGLAAALTAGASAAQLGTAFLRCPEAGTAGVVRAALTGTTRTALTRAFSGRRARGIRNPFLDQHTATAPAAYPQIHHATTAMRAQARAAGNPDMVNLWAGQAYPLGREEPAGEVVRRLTAEARAALAGANSRIGRSETER